MTIKGKHTPGPWVTNRFGTQVLTGDSWNTICEIYIGKDHRFAAWKDGRGATELDANARLIAAAPELLEALRLFIAEHDNTYDGEPLSVEMGRFITKARYAIAKAEGRSDAVRMED